MRGTYAFFKDKLFELDPVETQEKMMDYIDTTITSSYDTKLKEFTANIFLSRSDSDNLTNEEVYNNAVEKIMDDKLYYLVRLAERYRIVIEYGVYDANKRTVIDEGSLVKEVNSQNVLIPLGLDIHNNFVHRNGKLFENEVAFTYKVKTPYGVSMERNDRYVLAIKRISIFQNILDISGRDPHNHHKKKHIHWFDVNLNNVYKPFKPIECKNEHHHDILRNLFGDYHEPVRHRFNDYDIESGCMNYDEHGYFDYHNANKFDHPSASESFHQISDKMRFAEGSFVLIYDSKEEGIVFNDFVIHGFKPNKIKISTKILLNDYFYTRSKEDIQRYLDKNIPKIDEDDFVIGGDTHEELDPDGNRIFREFERCESSDEDALLVVPDDVIETSTEAEERYGGLEYTNLEVLETPIDYAYHKLKDDIELATIGVKTNTSDRLTIVLRAYEDIDVINIKTPIFNSRPMSDTDMDIEGKEISISIEKSLFKNLYNVLHIPCKDGSEIELILKVLNQPIFDDETMVKYGMVSKFISDIEIGEYVKVDNGLII